MSGVEWRGAGVTRECTWSGTIPRMNLIVTALNANLNSVSSVLSSSVLRENLKLDSLFATEKHISIQSQINFKPIILLIIFKIQMSHIAQHCPISYLLLLKIKKQTFSNKWYMKKIN